MESSPLTLAQHHAKAASTATHLSDTTVAVNEHALAAGEFAKAAVGTSSEEALRTLKLLEQHHKRLSELLKFTSENPPKTITDRDLTATSSEKTIPNSAAVSQLRHPKHEATQITPRRTPASTADLHVPRRMPPREMSSSIASNLASARGIRSSHNRTALSPSVTTLQAPGSLESPLRNSARKPQVSGGVMEQISGKPTWTPPMPRQNEGPSRPTPAESAPSATEEGFHRFYSTFENLFSKIAAPLAFAGLPLIAEEAPSRSPPSSKEPHATSKPTRTSSTEPDLTNYFSRAALRASALSNPGADSFYLVPTTGQTVSYANILSFAQKEKRRLAVSMHSENPALFDDADHDDFVDARETLGPPGPMRPTSRSVHGAKDMDNVVEELYTENQSLKDCIDKLSKRLHAFEMSAQTSSLALQESMRLMRPSSPALLPAPEVPDKKLLERVEALEDQLAAGEKEIQRMEKENDKLKNVVLRYRERWEKLKEGAKTRREGGSKDPSSVESSGRFLAG